MPIKSYGADNRTFPDPIYGSGKDGDFTASSNFSLNRDMYWNNLQINDGVHIDTNGYRVFVRNNMIFQGSVSQDADTSIGLINGSNSIGSILGGGTASVSNSLGGESGFYAAIDISSIFGSSSYFYNPDLAVNGYILNASQQSPLGVTGGAGDGTNPGGGVVIVSARRVSGNGTIYADGFNNGSSYTTGGGVIIYCSSREKPDTISLNVSGYEDGRILQFVV